MMILSNKQFKELTQSNTDALAATAEGISKLHRATNCLLDQHDSVVENMIQTKKGVEELRDYQRAYCDTIQNTVSEIITSKLRELKVSDHEIYEVAALNHKTLAKILKKLDSKPKKKTAKKDTDEW